LTIDDMVRPDAAEKLVDKSNKEVKENRANEIAMVCLSVVSVYMAATFVYFALWLLKNISVWQIFVTTSTYIYRYQDNINILIYYHKKIFLPSSFLNSTC